jgi:hypothetical protein
MTLRVSSASQCLILFTNTNNSTTQHFHALAWRNAPRMIFQKGHKLLWHRWKFLRFNRCFLHPYQGVGVVWPTWRPAHVTQYAILCCLNSKFQWRVSQYLLRSQLCGLCQCCVYICQRLTREYQGYVYIHNIIFFKIKRFAFVTQIWYVYWDTLIKFLTIIWNVRS